MLWWKKVVRSSWCAFDKVGYPLLLVMNTLVESITALTGSPIHLFQYSGAGSDSGTSRTTPRRLCDSHRKRSFCHHSQESCGQPAVTHRVPSDSQVPGQRLV